MFNVLEIIWYKIHFLSISFSKKAKNLFKNVNTMLIVSKSCQKWIRWMFCKKCAKFHRSIANFFWHCSSDLFLWSKGYSHQFSDLYPILHYFAIFSALQPLLIWTLSGSPVSWTQKSGSAPFKIAGTEIRSGCMNISIPSLPA